MQNAPASRAAIYIKETAGYPNGENSEELQVHHCEEYCRGHGFHIVARFHDGVCKRDNFDRMMGEAAQDELPFDLIVV